MGDELEGQADLFGPQYPPTLYDGTPPHEDVSTSRAAAASIRIPAGTLRARALEAIARAPAGLTDEEGIRLTGMAANTWRPRRRELYLLGKIKATGKRRTISGRLALVWQVKGD